MGHMGMHVVAYTVVCFWLQCNADSDCCRPATTFSVTTEVRPHGMLITRSRQTVRDEETTHLKFAK